MGNADIVERTVNGAFAKSPMMLDPRGSKPNQRVPLRSGVIGRGTREIGRKLIIELNQLLIRLFLASRDPLFELGQRVSICDLILPKFLNFHFGNSSLMFTIVIHVNLHELSFHL